MEPFYKNTSLLRTFIGLYCVHYRKVTLYFHRLDEFLSVTPEPYMNPVTLISSSNLPTQGDTDVNTIDCTTNIYNTLKTPGDNTEGDNDTKSEEFDDNSKIKARQSIVTSDSMEYLMVDCSSDKLLQQVSGSTVQIDNNELATNKNIQT